jgi:hypothetical protein
VLDCFSKALSGLSNAETAKTYASVFDIIDKESIKFLAARDKKKIFKEYLNKHASNKTLNYHPLTAVSHVQFPLASGTCPAQFGVPMPSHVAQISESWHKEERDTCTLCEGKFGPFRYRKHCRNCGQLVCDKCSPHMLVVPHLGKKPRRVCVGCVRSLEGQEQESSAKSGFLRKRGEKGLVKGWKKRWFRIAGDVLYYSESEEVASSGKIEKATILSIEPIADGQKSGLFDIVVAKGRAYHLDAGDDETRAGWIESLEKWRKV